MSFYFPTIRLELENIILSNIIILCFHHCIFRDFKQKLSLNFSNHGGIRSHHIVKHLQLSVKGLEHRGSYLLYMKNPSAQNLKVAKMS